jgi:hypothetical protein
MNLVEHAQNELKLAGFDLKDTTDSFESYGNRCAQAALELVKVFSEQHHSGYSAGVTLSLFEKLANHKNLTPLTRNADEWVDTVKCGWQEEDSTSARYQSKRNSGCFSYDLKTYYDMYDEDNLIFELDDQGNRTGYTSLKAKSDIHFKELINA